MWTSRKKIMKMSQNFIAQIVLVVSMVYENQVHTKKAKKFSSVLSAKVIGTIYFQHIRLSSLKVDLKPTFFFNRWNYHLWSSQNETNKHKFSNLSCPLGPSIKYVRAFKRGRGQKLRKKRWRIGIKKCWFVGGGAKDCKKSADVLYGRPKRQ